MHRMDHTAHDRKVFGLGLARTGTTSMHRAMLRLGLRSAPDSTALLDELDLDFLGRYDSFFDNPIPFRYRALDDLYPNSLYIVTTRPVEAWLTSMEYLFGPGLDRLDADTRALGDRVHRNVYGTDQFEPETFAEIHQRHYRDVRLFVADRPHVWLDMESGFDWDQICKLLELPVPRSRFPHANRRNRWWHLGR